VGWPPGNCGGSIFHSPFSRTKAISPVSESSPFWRWTLSVALSPLTCEPLIWNFVPSTSFCIFLTASAACPTWLASIPWYIRA
jgi:hypothetical protein